MKAVLVAYREDIEAVSATLIFGDIMASGGQILRATV